MGRCNSPNKCAYCGRLSAVLWAEMFALDALDGNAPSIYVVLTTRTSDFNPRSFWKAREAVYKAIKRRWPEAQVAWIVEATTGTSERSGGRRYPHWNLLVKNVPADELERLRQVIVPVWCGRVDARPEAQWVGPVEELGGLMRYLALHFLKSSQAMPEGFTGHRVIVTRGYFTDERWKLRARAREALAGKRELHRAIKAGYEGLEAETVSQAALYASLSREWELVRLIACPETGELEKVVRALDGGEAGQPRGVVNERWVPHSNGRGAVTWTRELRSTNRHGFPLQAGELERELEGAGASA